MPDIPDHDNLPANRAGASRVPLYTTDWDRLLTIYNIQELPIIPADGDPGSEGIPVGVKVMREFLLDAAGTYASEIWFNFGPDGESIEVCYSPPGKGTIAVQVPRALFFKDDEEYGILGFLMDRFTDDGMFAIHASEFKDTPPSLMKRSPFDKRGRIIQPTTPPDPPDPPDPPPSETENEIPGITETVTIRAFRISLKGRTVPDDLVIQICPRFWHMPTGFQVG